MQGLRLDSSACRYIAEHLGDEKFTLLDIGCSGGISPIWRLFGERLMAYCFDPNIGECERLAASETLPGVQYIAAFVGLPDDDPVVRRRRGKPYTQNSPWGRLSVARTLEIRQKRNASQTARELTTENLWQQVPLADPNTPIIMPKFLSDYAIANVDMIKIDIDGPDFEVLQSLSDSLIRCNVLALGLEVNFFGTADENDHTLCNTDRFMRAHGFDLFHITARPYSLTALPSSYELSVPAQTQYGRPLQGDAFYARDLGQAGSIERPEKLAKLAAIFAAIGLFDCAAEIFVTHRDRLNAIFDVDTVLDLLCKEAQKGVESPLSYRDYMAAFERDDQIFYPKAFGASKTGHVNDPGKISRLAAKSPSKLLAAGVCRFRNWLRDNVEREVDGPVTKLPLELLEAWHGNVSNRDDEIVVTSPAQQWAYAAGAALRLPHGASGPAVVRVKLHVEQGEVGVGVVARGNSPTMLAEKSAQATSAPLDVCLNLADVAEAGFLVLRSWSSDGVVSRARIYSIETTLQHRP